MQTLQMPLEGVVEGASGRRDGVLLNTTGLQFASPVNQTWFLVCEEVHRSSFNTGKALGDSQLMGGMEMNAVMGMLDLIGSLV